jgi:hypothetical protein
MVRLSRKAIEDRRRADELGWADVERLWTQVQDRNVVGWDAGKALEHLVIRGFSLSGLRVEYPYEVALGGRTLEQVDGMVYLGEVPFLVECKDRPSVDIEVIAKLRNQLGRRPPSTMGCVFSSGEFTAPAIILANFAVPHRITLWARDDIGEAIEGRDFAALLRRKYHELCMFGLTDHSLRTRYSREAADG